MNIKSFKLIVGVGLLITWILLVFAKAYYPPLDITALEATIQSAFTGLGVHAITSKGAQP